MKGICTHLLLLLWSPSPSEPAWRLVSGVVRDASGNVLPASVVQLENELDLSIRSYITGADGRYHFSELRHRLHTESSIPEILVQSQDTQQL